MCTFKQSYGNTGVVNIATANTALDGSGTLGTVLTALASGSGGSGTKIEKITIKADGDTTEGMVRLFVNDGSTTYLYKEVIIPNITRYATEPTFQVSFEETLDLNPGDKLYASTENAESFNVIAYGIDFKNCDCDTNGAISCGTIKYDANTGLVNIATANTNLDGSGTLGTILTSPTGTLKGGTRIPEITIKSAQTTTDGMIRLFLYDGSTNYLFSEIMVPGMTPSEVETAFRVIGAYNVLLEAGYSIKGSTENSESFNILTFASDWENCACL